MAAMKRDVNLGLLLVIVAAIIVFSGFTVYYQTTFKSLSTTYQNEIKELGKVTTDLEAKRSQLNETSVQLQLKKQKEDDLSKKYVDTASERDGLQSDKTKLTADLASTKLTLSQTQADLANSKAEVARQYQVAQDLDAKVRTLKADVANRDADIARIKAQRDCYQNAAPGGASC